MAVELKMPALTPTMEKGTLAKWLVAVGDRVKAGDLIAEIETEKATMEFEAVDEGRVARLIVSAGTGDVPVGTIIALLISDNEEVDATAAIIPKPAAVLKPVFKGEAAAAPIVPAPAKAVVLAQNHALVVDQVSNATPLVRRIAAVKGIDLSTVTGSGARGKIVMRDLGLPLAIGPVSAGHAAPPVTLLPTAPTIAPPPAGVPIETVKLSGMRTTIARRLTQSKQTIPHFYLTARCNIDSLLKLRAELNLGLAAQEVRLSVNDFLIKALARALIMVPDAHVQFGGDVLHRFGRADISMAVAIDGGLITPVIQDAGSLSLTAIASRTKLLAAKARDGKLLPEDYQGGTATISNLGMFGIDEMFPVINPPQALILGVAAGVEQPWKVAGGVALATIMAATASFDHRAIDGAVAAQFMAALRGYVEHPTSMLI